MIANLTGAELFKIEQVTPHKEYKLIFYLYCVCGNREL